MASSSTPSKLDLDSFIATALSATPSSLHRYFNKFKTLYEKRLWHQLTGVLAEFFALPDARPYRLDTFEAFVRDFESKINPLRLVELGVRAGTDIDNPQTHLTFLTSLLDRLPSPPSTTAAAPTRGKKSLADEATDPSAAPARVLLLSSIAHAKLVYGDLNGARSSLDDAGKQLEELDNVEGSVNAGYYEVEAEYYKGKADYGGYYRNSLLYLACIDPEKDLTSEQRLSRAHDLTIAALLADTIYNFGELLGVGIVEEMRNSPHAYLHTLLHIFNEGNIGKFEGVAPLLGKEPILQENYAFLRQKICLMALIESVFRRPVGKRKLEFQTIAEETRLPLEEVEHLVMKGLSLKLIRGTLDQPTQTATITWVQPRVLGREQIRSLAARLDTWVQDLGRVEDRVAEEQQSGAVPSA